MITLTGKNAGHHDTLSHYHLLISTLLASAVSVLVIRDERGNRRQKNRFSDEESSGRAILPSSSMCRHVCCQYHRAVIVALL